MPRKLAQDDILTAIVIRLSSLMLHWDSFVPSLGSLSPSDSVPCWSKASWENGIVGKHVGWLCSNMLKILASEEIFREDRMDTH